MTARRSIVVATAVSVILIVIPAVTTWLPRVLWNASASVPLGLYRLHPVGKVAIGDLVAVQPPAALLDFLDVRGYLPRGVPLLKQVVALEGALICRSGDWVTVDHRLLGQAQAQDRIGRDLPVWQGCRRLGAGEVFLMNPDAPDSLDGRYFGPLPRTAITARLTPLWIVSDGAIAGSAHPDPTPTTTERRHAMPQIGEFTRTKSGFAGYVRTLTLDLEVSLTKAEATEAENGPDYRLFRGDGDLAREIGAAWARTGEKAGEYFSVLIDDPMLAQPIRANLFRNGESSVWSLQWTRPPKRNGAA